MSDFLQALGWLSALLFVVPAVVYVAGLVRSRVRPTREFVQIYGIFLLMSFVLAVAVVALSWTLSPPTRAIVAATVVYLVALVCPVTSPMARYPLYVIRYGRLPVVATVFAAAYSYITPEDPHYAVTPLDTHLFRSPEDAEAAGFRPSRRSRRSKRPTPPKHRPS